MTHAGVKALTSELAPAQSGSPTQEKCGTGSSPDTGLAYCTAYQPAPATGAGYKKEEVLGKKFFFQHSTGQHNHTWLTIPLLKQEKFKKA